MALQFDRVELKGGKTMPVHLQIQSISPAEGAASVSGSSAIAGAATNGSQAAGLLTGARVVRRMATPAQAAGRRAQAALPGQRP
jgi:hypothetical protein